MLTEHAGHKLWGRNRHSMITLGLIAVAMQLLPPIQNHAQSPLATPSTETSGSKKNQFDVASVKQNKSDDKPKSNFLLGPGDVYAPNGGLFSASSTPLIVYIAFAYKLTNNQLQFLRSGLPDWVSFDRFDIQARSEGSPTKDEMRLMMRSLLADRFKLTVHNETRQVPVLALLLSKPEKTGPRLRPHPNDSSCSTTLAPEPDRGSSAATSSTADGFPQTCGGPVLIPTSAPGRLSVGARNVNIGLIASALPDWGALGRPVLDRTELSGTFDFTLEWAPETHHSMASGMDTLSETSGPTFLEALQEQLGLKLEAQKGPVDFIVVDHIEHLSLN
jgi:uncharacterized protein (TIGR03435 family)